MDKRSVKRFWKLQRESQKRIVTSWSMLIAGVGCLASVLFSFVASGDEVKWLDVAAWVFVTVGGVALVARGLRR